MTVPTQPPVMTELRIAANLDPVTWDAFVRRTDGATFCHLSGWQDVISRSMRQAPQYLAAIDTAGDVHGVLPLVRLRSALFGTRWVSMPYLNDGGALGSAAAVTALHDAAARHAGSSSLELRVRTSSSVVDPEACDKVTVLLPLPDDADTLWSSFPAKLRSQVRRPQKAGMDVRFGVDQLDCFYSVWAENMRDLGTPVLPRTFFHAIAETFPDELIVGCVYRDDVPVAAGAGFLFRDEFEITWASSLRAYNREAPNMLLYWEFMGRAIESGARTFNFGRCTPGGGTHRFKLQWGGSTVPLPWIRAPRHEGGAGAGRVARQVSNAWQKLPLGLANAIGPHVARMLPWW